MTKEDKKNNLEEEREPYLEEIHEQGMKIAELTDQLKRSLAEFDNYKKRVEREGCERARFASQDLVKRILPVLDNLERATKAGENAEEIRKGVALIHDQLKGILSQEQVEKMETAGQMFDPRRHEALLKEEADTDGIILEEFEPGYTMHGRVIKHARVKVGRRKEKKDGEVPGKEETPKNPRGKDEDHQDDESS